MATDLAKLDAAPVMRMQSVREQELVRSIIHEFSQYTIWRNNFALQWEESAQLVYPEHRNTFFYGSWNWQG